MCVDLLGRISLWAVQVETARAGMVDLYVPMDRAPPVTINRFMTVHRAWVLE